jgi:hypothetical protein
VRTSELLQDSGFADGPSLDLPKPENGLDRSSYSSFVPALCIAKTSIVSACWKTLEKKSSSWDFAFAKVN